MTAIGPNIVAQGALIRTARKRARMPLREVCASLDISTAFLSDVERGHRLLSTERLDALAACLGCTVGDLGGPRHVDRPLALWLRDNPAIVAVLVEAKRTGRAVVLAPESNR